MTVSIAQCRKRAEVIKEVADSWRLDAELFLAKVLQCSRYRLIGWSEQVLTAEQLQEFDDCLERRRAGEPVAYIIGQRDFWNIELQIDHRVLIPRPETELLVELSLLLFPGYGRSASFADLGTGSGAIALSLARERRKASVVATDISADALEVAQLNARRMNLDNVRFLLGSWCSGFNDEVFDLIVSNPPYIAEGDPHLEQGDIRFEPAVALSSGPDGLRDIRQIAQQSRRHLKPGGWLLLEHGYDQREPVRQIMHANGYKDVRSWQDLSGNDRVCGGRAS